MNNKAAAAVEHLCKALGYAGRFYHSGVGGVYSRFLSSRLDAAYQLLPDDQPPFPNQKD